MKKFGIPAVRLCLAGRVLQKLNMADNIEGLGRVSRYIQERAERFGLRLSAIEREMEPETFGDLVIARSGMQICAAFDQQIKVELAVYLASLLGNDEGRINGLTYLALASIDATVRDLAMVATLGSRPTAASSRFPTPAWRC